jgi:hypothetical protein
MLERRRDCGSNVSFGFNANYSGPDTAPTAPRVNGMDCSTP